MADPTVSVGTEVAKGVIVGGLLTGAVVALAPVALPILGLGALAGTITGTVGLLPWIGAGLGGYYKYTQATK